MKVESVEISSIDLEDYTFRLGDTSSDKQLNDSIKSIGQINPVILGSSGNNFKIITGWKRILALKELGEKSVAAIVHIFTEDNIPNFLYTIYFDNKLRFTDLDKAELINKFKTFCGFSDNEILEEVFPKLSIKSSKNNLKKFTSVASLNSEIKKLFYQDYFTFEQLVMFSEIEDEDYKETVIDRVFEKFRFNNNETREILREIYEIAKRDGVTFDECIDVIFKEIGQNGNKNDFKKKVRFMRYPNLMKVEEKFKDGSKGFESIKNLNLFHHPYFETNEIELRLKVGSIDEYIQTLDKLSDTESIERFESLLKLIKEGN